MICDPDRLLEFIQAHGLKYKQNARSYIFTCPRCHKDELLWMERRNGRFKCFYCATLERFQGRPEFALADLALVPLAEVRKFLYGKSYTGTAMELDIQLGEDDDLIDDHVVEIPEMAWPLTYYPINHRHSIRGLDYLATRGIDLAMAQKYHLRFSPEERRVIFPVELGERLVGWQKRLIIPTKHWDEEEEKFHDAAKMLSSKDIPTAHVVMFANNLRDSEHAVVCEGPIDAIKADWCGGNVATMGKAVGPGQILTLRDPGRLNRWVGDIWGSGIRKVYLALDPDAARETERLVREFSDLEVYLMHPPAPYEDLGEMDYPEVLELFRSAPRVNPGRVFISLPRPAART